jgi:hypothetical protein
MLAGAACTQSDDDDDGAVDAGAGNEEASGELGTGVTEDSIKISLAYVDIEALVESAGLDLFHGPYEDIMTALVDDVNAEGGINGRSLELSFAPYDPVGAEAALAACTKATEDDQVFAVLGGFQADQNLCVVEQHETILVGGTQSPALLERARAPWASPDPAAQHSVQALVQALDDAGELDGRTIGIYGIRGDEPAIEAAREALEGAGGEVVFEGVNDADQTDIAGGEAQSRTLGQRMKDEGVDAVVFAGGHIPAAQFDDVDFHPRLWISNLNNMAVWAGEVFLEFPDVFTVGTASPQDAFESEPFQHCVDVYEEASGETVLSPEEAAEQDAKTPIPALQFTCANLLIFTEAVEAAGETLNQATFLEGLESLDSIELPGGTGSFGADKFDAPLEYWSYGYNEDYGGITSGDEPGVLRDEAPFTLDAS